MRLRPGQVAAVYLAGRRGGGERRGSLGRLLEASRIWWLIMEPRGFARSLLVRFRARFLGCRDPRSVAGTARRLGIPVHDVGDPNGGAFHALLRETSPDLVLNQAEFLLKEEVLAIPRRGFINRHASLLPAFPGRMASFWSHAAEPPRYGVTIHAVDAGLDTGGVILQEELHDCDHRWPYPKVMERLCRAAAPMLWEAVDRMESEGFEPSRQAPGERPCAFPTLADAERYREMMRKRRRGPSSSARIP
jgi:methionyl-tRNA formyltransferase